MLHEKRTYNRVNTDIDCLAYIKGREHRATIVNISEEGMGLVLSNISDDEPVQGENIIVNFVDELNWPGREDDDNIFFLSADVQQRRPLDGRTYIGCHIFNYDYSRYVLNKKSMHYMHAFA